MAFLHSHWQGARLGWRVHLMRGAGRGGGHLHGQVRGKPIPCCKREFQKTKVSGPIVVCIKWRLRFVEKMHPHPKLNRTINGLRESLTSPDGTQGSTLSLDPLLVDKVVGGWRLFVNDCRSKIFWVIQIAWGQKGEEKKIEDEEQKKCIFLIPSRFLYCFIYFSSDWLQPGHHHR